MPRFMPDNSATRPPGQLVVVGQGIIANFTVTVAAPANVSVTTGLDIGATPSVVVS